MARSNSYIFKVLFVAELAEGEPSQYAAAVREAIEAQLTDLQVKAQDDGRLQAGRYQLKVFSAALADKKTAALVRGALPAGKIG